MKTQDAANLLNLTGRITPELARAAWLAACKKYHPDVNPAGEQMMKLVNAAYDVLKDFAGETEGQDRDPSYSEAINAALNAIIDLPGLEIEICGAWVWVSGETFPHKDTLKASGFRWASKKKMWHFRPEEWKSASRGKMSMDEIRGKFGSERPNFKKRGALAAEEREAA